MSLVTYGYYCGIEKWSSRYFHRVQIVGSTPTPAIGANNCLDSSFRWIGKTSNINGNVQIYI